MQEGNQPSGICPSGVVMCVLFLCFLQPLESRGVSWPWKWNKLDKEGNRHGRWRSYYEENPKILFNRGRYKHGKETGRWKTYSANGKLYFKEKVEPDKKRMKTTYYHENGNISHRGMAYQVQNNKSWKYSLHGDWEYYDSTGHLLGIKTYQQGKLISDTSPSGERITSKQK